MAELILALGWIAMIVAFLLGRQLRSRKPSLRLPPGPKGAPVFGSLFSVFKDSSKLPHQVLSELSKKYGPIILLRLGSRLAIAVSTPNLAKEILKDNDRNFANRPHYSVKDHLLFPTGTIGFSLYDTHFRNVRKLCASELLNNARVQQLEWVRTEELAMTVRSILADSRQHGTDADKLSPVNINIKTSFLILNSMTRSLFGKRFFNYGNVREEATSYSSDPQEAVEFEELLDEIVRLLMVPIFKDYVPYLGFLDILTGYKKQMRKTRDRFDVFLGSVVKDHRERLRSAGVGAVAERDILDVMLNLADRGETGGLQLDDKKIKGAIFDLLTGGTTTSSTTVEWALAELLRAPQILHKTQQELDSVVALVGRERLVTEADIPSLPLLKAVIKETFRLHPPAPLLVPHESIEDCQIAGYHIPAKTTLFVNVWEIGRSPDVWQNPLVFRPERFEGSDIEPKGSHFELLPFGTGRRGCPGMNLGLLTVQHTLARLLQAFDWTLPHGQTAEDLDMAEAPGIIISPAQPLWAVPHPRLPAQMYE